MIKQKFEFWPSAKKVQNGKGFNIEVSIDDGAVAIDRKGDNSFISLPESARDFFILYGIKQKLADSYSSHKDQAEFDGFFNGALDKAIAGELEIRAPGGAPMDPRAKMVVAVAKQYLTKAVADAGKKLPKVASDAYKTLLANFTTQNDGVVQKEVNRRMAENAALSIDGIVLDMEGVSGDVKDATPAKK